MICMQGICGFLSFQRFKAGFDSAFGGGIDEEALRNQAHRTNFTRRREHDINKRLNNAPIPLSYCFG